MHAAPDLTQWLWLAAGWSPQLFWMLIGALLCCVNARAQPRRSTLIGIALAILAASTLLSYFVGGLLVEWLLSRLPNRETALAAHQIAVNLPHAFAMLLILWGAFYGDSRTPSDLDVE